MPDLEVARFADRRFRAGGLPERCRSPSGRRIYDTIGGDRRQRWRQVYYRSALSAEGFVVRTVRAPRRPGKPETVADRDQANAVQATLADDLVQLARELTTAVLLAGGEAYASAVSVARECGAEVVLLVPPGACELTTGPLIQAATRAIRLHPEVFEALFEVHSGWRPRQGRVAARSASVAGAC